MLQIKLKYRWNLFKKIIDTVNLWKSKNKHLWHRKIIKIAMNYKII